MTRRRPLGLGTHIVVTDADAAVRFYSEAFGAAELVRLHAPRVACSDKVAARVPAGPTEGGWTGS